MEQGFWQGVALSTATPGGQQIVSWGWSVVVLVVTMGFVWWMGSSRRGRSAGEGGSSSSPATADGIRRITESLYKLCEPTSSLEVEIVFIHGLQLYDYKDAYWRTWLGGKEGRQVVWPKTWLTEDLPGARIWSLSYDACAVRTDTSGTMDLFLAAEGLVQNLVEFAKCGEQNRPIVFVCHCLGGLVVKEMVRIAHVKYGKNAAYTKFLMNIRGFQFYSTPHSGSKLADLASHLPKMGRMVDVLRVINKELGRLNSEFERIESDGYADRWKFSVISETHKTTFSGFSDVVVEEASARHVYNEFLAVSADHFEVCKPERRESSSYLRVRDFIKDIIYHHKLTYDLPLELPRLVGIEDKFMEVCEALKVHPIVGLVGMGGIGKTTLSKHFYNCKKAGFEKFVFLEDVKSSDIQVSQKRLFAKLCGGNWDDEDVSVQMEKIRQCMIKKKVLVVVDDVGNAENMKALNVDAFKDGKDGSRVIVTTRGRDILLGLVSKEAIISVGELNEEHSLALFTYYAFDKSVESVRVQLDDLAKEIAKACGGLPLSLEVMGQFLRKYNDPTEDDVMSIWKKALDKLREAGSLDGSEERLWASIKMSYDNLSTSYQMMFLDFACIMSELAVSEEEVEFRGFTNRIEGQTIVRIWDDDVIGVRHLVNRSLMKWSDDKRTLVMHDQVRDWGRRMVRESANGNIANMTHIWERDEGLQFMEQNNICGGLQGLVLRMISSKSHENEVEIHSEKNYLQSPCRLWTLRLLCLEGISSLLVQHYVRLCSKELRWLRLNDTTITQNSIQNLGSFKKLRVLQMKGCESLVEVPGGIGRLSCLTELDISHCGGLKGLPDEIGDLGKLQVLRMSGCESLLEVPGGIGRLSCLTELDLSDCDGLTALPDEIGDLGKLQVLRMFGCESLLEVPGGIGRLSCLTELDISDCGGLEGLPDEIGDLGKLQVLRMSTCESLLEVPRGIGRLSCLTELDITDCDGLTGLPDEIGELGKLQILQMSGCWWLPEVPVGIGRLSGLTELDISHCGGFKALPDEIGNLGKLQVLRMSGCDSLLEVSGGIGRLSCLTKLDISSPGLKGLPNEIGDLGKLQELRMSGCKSLLEVPGGIGRLSCLTKLDISDCGGLKGLPDEIGDLGKLQVLRMVRCESLLEVPGIIGRLSCLTELDISNCGGLKGLPDEIGDLGKLQVLRMVRCESLLEVPGGIGRLSCLTELDLSGCYGLKGLPDEIGNLGKLQVLRMYWCLSLLEVPRGIGRLSCLTELGISGCRGLKGLPHEIGDLGKLQVLALDDCSSLVYLPSSVLKLLESFGQLSQLRSSNVLTC